ncbi:MAG: AAA family ATPase [Thermodesulfobacteriota bacterium]
MGISIAFSGKGGTGKTTLCGMLIRYMLQKDMAPLLAVDADPNYNLNEVLGVEVEKTLGQVREQMKQGDVPSGMTKDRFMSMKLEEAIVESQGFDLVVMGQPEGQGCYCAANTLLSDFMYKLSDNYSYIAMDNEAGMEHISRLTTSNIDYLLVASDPSKRGLQAAQRIHELARTLPVHIKNIGLILNNVQQEPAGKMLQLIQDTGLELLGSVYMDEGVQEFDLQGRPTFELPADNPALLSAFRIFDRILAV